jgi:hypothetical protein
MYAIIIFSFLIIILLYFLNGKRNREQFLKKLLNKAEKVKKAKKEKKKATPVIEESADSDKQIVGVPESYFEDIKYKLQDQWKANFDNLYEFKTSDDKYTCMFMNSANVKNVPFIRTVVPYEYNELYTLSTTECPPTAKKGDCNKDKSLNIEGKLFYEDVENVDYSVNRNKVFLHTDDGYTYKDFNKNSNDEVNLTYRTTYEICKPYGSASGSNFNYDFTRGFDQLFPCGYVQCTNSKKSRKLKKTRSSVINNQKKIIKNEHQSKIDEILESLGFQTWIKALKTIQNRNQTISNMCDKVGRGCQTGTAAKKIINNIMTADDDLEPI